MVRHGKIRVIMAVAVAAMLSIIAVVVRGMSPAPVIVKLTPVMVSVDTSTLAPKLAEAEMEAVRRLFDRDTDAAFMPMDTARVTVRLSDVRTVNGIRVYGASSYKLNVYDENGKPVPSLSGIALTALESTWSSFTPTETLSTSSLLLEFIPQGNVTAGVREVEIWGTEAASGDKSAAHLTLEGVRTPQDMLDILAKSPSHIFEYSAAPSEISVAEGSAPSVSIGLLQDPMLFKRAYILYDGYNLVRSASIQRRINGLSWSGGFVITQSQDASPSWSSYLEEINPAWLAQGENRIEFRTTGGTAAIRGLRLIVDTDSGLNMISSVSAAGAYDGDTATFSTIAASSTNPSIQINFDRSVQPVALQLHIPRPMNLTAGLQYLSGGTWQDVKTGWQINFMTLQTGWNEITLPSPVTTQTLRLVFNTSGLKSKPGVQVGAISEIRVAASPVGAVFSSPRIVISYPRDGEYFGRTAFIQGFATPVRDQAGNAAWVSVEGKDGQRTVADGSFSLSLSKDETHFYDQADDEPW